MSQRSFLLFTLVTAFVVVAAIYTYPGSTTSNPAPGKPFFSSLNAEAINKVSSVAITSKGETFTIERKDKGWVVKELGGYPAQANLVKTTLVGLSELRPFEKKTAESDRLDKLDLEDPKKKGSASKRITIKDAAGKVLADVVIGKSVSNSVVYGQQMVYLRMPDSTQSYLAVGDPQPKTSAVEWAEKKVMDIHNARVKQVVQGDGKDKTLTAFREKVGAETSIKDVPEGRKLKSAQIRNYIMEALQGLNLEDVTPASKIDFEKNKSGTAVYTTYDGITVTAVMATVDKKVWIRYEASFDPANAMKEPPKGSKILTPEAAKKQVDEINARIKGWAYNVSSSVYRFMEYGMNDILEEEKKK